MVRDLGTLLNDCTDENLADACRKGDRSAYAVLVKRYYRLVFAVCLGMLGNIQDAEDMAQDAMFKGFLKIKKLRRAEHFAPWVLRIAKNLCIDLLRRQRHVKTILTGPAAKTEQKAGDNYDLQQCIRRLPGQLRLPLVMYYLDNKNTKAIAEKLNISHSTVCSRIRQARNQLHKLLTQEVDNE